MVTSGTRTSDFTRNVLQYLNIANIDLVSSFTTALSFKVMSTQYFWAPRIYRHPLVLHRFRYNQRSTFLSVSFTKEPVVRVYIFGFGLPKPGARGLVVPCLTKTRENLQ